MSKEQKNVPKLRFPEFTGEWEQRTCNEILRPVKGAMKIGPFGSALKKEFYTESGVKVYAQENIFQEDFSIGNYYISDERYQSLKGCKLEPGDLVISMMGTIGACAIFPEKAEPGIMNSHLLRLQLKEDVYPEYIHQLLRDSQSIRNQIERLSVGSIMSGLSSSVVQRIVFPIPSVHEQKKIADILTNFDTLITLQQRKLDQIKEYKKGMLQKMFPKDGASVPEVRFPGFTGEWERKKLGELAEVKDSARIPNSEWTDSGVPYIRASDLTNDDTSGVLFISSERYDYYRSKTGAPAQGDVLFNGGGEIGKALLHSNNKPIYVQGGAVLYARTSVSESLDGQFLKTYFETPNAKSYIDIASAGGTMKHFTLKPSLEMPIQFPIIPEQLQLGSFFKSLDTLITLHQRKLDAMKEYKKGLLQQMFV